MFKNVKSPKKKQFFFLHPKQSKIILNYLKKIKNHLNYLKPCHLKLSKII